MSQFMRHVNEEGTLRRELLDDVQRFIQRGVGRMWATSERVEEQNIQTMQSVHRRVRNRPEICEICRGAKTVRSNCRIAMQNSQRLKLGAEQIESSIKPVQCDLRPRRVGRVRIEDIRKHALDNLRRVVIGIKRQFLFALERKGTQI